MIEKIDDYREEIKNKVKKLKEENIPVYSISRLNTIENCKYEFYKTYMLKTEGINNIYRLNRFTFTSNNR